MKYIILLPLLLFSTHSDAGLYSGVTTKISKTGSCVCKTRCTQWAKQGQYTPSGLAQCVKNCQEKYAGCSAGSYYGR